MKKILTLLVAVLATATVAHAQFGIIGGWTTAQLNTKDLRTSKASTTSTPVLLIMQNSPWDLPSSRNSLMKEKGPRFNPARVFM